MVSLAEKLKLPKKVSRDALELLCAKNGSKKYLKRTHKFWTIAKTGHNSKAIGFAKWSVWLKNSNCQNVSRDTLELFCGEDSSKKHLIFEKWKLIMENWRRVPRETRATEWCVALEVFSDRSEESDSSINLLTRS